MLSILHFAIINRFIVTGTFKLKKTELQKQSFDPNKCGSDKLLYYNQKIDKFELLTTKEFDDICQGRIKF